MASTMRRMPMSEDEIGMAPRLGEHALARIDEDDGKIGGRGAGHHVCACIAHGRGVSATMNFAPVGREEAIGDVDGDALLALRRRGPSTRSAKIDRAALRARPSWKSASRAAS